MRNWIIVFFVIFAARLSAHDGDSIKITHGPYLCDMSTDGVTVVWTTNKPALSWVEVAPAGEDHFYGKERPRYYDTESGRKRANDTIHRVLIKHLEPGREYRYRIFSREVVSYAAYVRLRRPYSGRPASGNGFYRIRQSRMVGLSFRKTHENTQNRICHTLCDPYGNHLLDFRRDIGPLGSFSRNMGGTGKIQDRNHHHVRRIPAFLGIPVLPQKT